MGGQYRDPVRMPLEDVPDGAVLIGPGGRLYMAAPKTFVSTLAGVRAVIDYSGNFNMGALAMEVTTLIPDAGRNGDLDKVAPFNHTGWQYAVN